MADGVRGDGYYRWFPGDYMRDTADLSMTEDGAYRRLLDFYYSEEHLPSDASRLYRIARALSDQERGAVDHIVSRFFRVKKDRLFNPRAEREIEERKRFLAEQSRKGKLSGESRRRKTKGTYGEPERNPGLTPVEPGHEPEGEPKPNQASASASASALPSASASKAILKPSSPTRTPARGDIYPQTFTAFWNLYPRKVEKRVALNAFNALAKKNEFRIEDLMAATQHYRNFTGGREAEFIKHPATFLAKERWRDFVKPREPTAGEPKGWAGLREYIRRREEENAGPGVQQGDGDSPGDVSEHGEQAGDAGHLEGAPRRP